MMHLREKWNKLNSLLTPFVFKGSTCAYNIKKKHYVLIIFM